MLTLTENASSAVKNLASQIPTETGGLRIAEAADPQAGYALSLAPAPEQGDTVVESDGARVFVDEAATVALGDRILDARVDPDGSVGFALAQAV
jgi:iron-sulfur cluster assembly protein